METAWLIVGILGFALAWALAEFHNRGVDLGAAKANAEDLLEAIHRQQKVIDAQDRMLEAVISAVPDRDALVKRLRDGTF